MTGHQRNLSDAIGFITTDCQDALNAAELALADAKRNNAPLAELDRLTNLQGLLRGMHCVSTVALDLSRTN